MFNALNNGNYEPVFDSLVPKFEHWFIGEHALSGLRTSLSVTRQWYERLYKIFPNIHFYLKNIAVQGAPWDTTVTVEWDDSYTLLAISWIVLRFFFQPRMKLHPFFLLSRLLLLKSLSHFGF